GLQGYQAFGGDLRASGALEWPLRSALIAGGIVLATPGGGILPFSNLQMELAGAAILLPAWLLLLWASRRVAPGARGRGS
ncbi:MAG: TRAP transporter permease, partial [Pseudomonadota bacterium]